VTSQSNNPCLDIGHPVRIVFTQLQISETSPLNSIRKKRELNRLKGVLSEFICNNQNKRAVL